MTYLLVLGVVDDVRVCNAGSLRLHKWWQFTVAKHKRSIRLLPLLWFLLLPLFVLFVLLLTLLKLHRRGKDVTFDTFSWLRNWFRVFLEQMNHFAATLWKKLDERENLHDTNGSACNSSHIASVISITWLACCCEVASDRTLFACEISFVTYSSFSVLNMFQK